MLYFCCNLPGPNPVSIDRGFARIAEVRGLSTDFCATALAADFRKYHDGTQEMKNGNKV